MRRLLFMSCALVGVVACGGDDPSPIAPSALPAAVTTFRASGTVREIAGGPVAEAVVSAMSCDETPSYHHVFGKTSTDSTGGFLLQVDSGTESPIGCVYLRVEKTGYVPASLEWGRSGNGLLIEVLRLRKATGRLVEIDGGPVAGATITISGQTTTATTNAAGFFTLDGVGRGASFSKNGYVERGVVVPDGRDVDLGTVYIQRSISLARGKAVVSRLSSADVAYDFYDMWDVGVFCNPCKWIDLETGQQNVYVQLKWSGEAPLTLWSTTDYYNASRVVTARPGESVLSVVVDAATRGLLVGLKSDSFDSPYPIAEPIAFEVSVRSQ